MGISTNTTSLEDILEIINELPNKPQTITSTMEVTEGSASPYPENSLYIVYEG